MKIAKVLVDKCSNCPYVEFDNQEDVNKWGKFWCTELHKLVKQNNIDDLCELENDD